MIDSQVFVIQPSRFRLERQDGLVIRVPAESESVAVQFIGTQRKGLTRLDDGAFYCYARAVESSRINNCRNIVDEFCHQV